MGLITHPSPTAKNAAASFPGSNERQGNRDYIDYTDSAMDLGQTHND
jgi:hypothetical protein